MSAIPKVIHYCWFGGNDLGEKELRCIESWRKFLPNYEIRRWDESNWDVRCCEYVSEAYDAKKWAFVSDYARFEILYKQGGLYFDTDVEVIKPIGDIVAKGPFMGFETDWAPEAGQSTVAPGLGLAANPGLDLYKAVLDSFNGDHFVKTDGTYDETTIVTRTTAILAQRGLEARDGIQRVDGVWIYPSEYFNPKDYATGVIRTTENTRTIHHFSMSWISPLDKARHEYMAKMLNRGMNQRVAEVLSKLAATVKMRDLTYFKNKLH